MIPYVRDLQVEYGRVDPVSPLIRRVIAENPGPFTYLGTGTYIVGRGEVAVIDPGPELPAHLDAKAMLPRAVKELVAYTPGTAFFADGGGRNAIRLSFCYPTPDFVREGIRRLATVINGELTLLNEFAQTGPLAVQPQPEGVLPPNVG